MTDTPEGFSGNRIVDVVFFFHGILNTSEIERCEPQLDYDNVDLFQVPERTEFYSYCRLEDDFEVMASNEDRLKTFMISRI